MRQVGEGDNGMKAVATVIMNRVNVSSGEYSRISQGGSVRNMTPTDIHYQIADWALSGNKLNEIGECLWYLNPFRPTCNQTFPSNGSGTLHTRFGNHCFYRPTSLYDNT